MVKVVNISREIYHLLAASFLAFFSSFLTKRRFSSWSVGPKRALGEPKVRVLMVVNMIEVMMVLIKTNDTDTGGTDTNLLTLCGFDPGGEGVWRRSSSDELEFLGKYVVNIIF